MSKNFWESVNDEDLRRAVEEYDAILKNAESPSYGFPIPGRNVNPFQRYVNARNIIRIARSAGALPKNKAVRRGDGGEIQVEPIEVARQMYDEANRRAALRKQSAPEATPEISSSARGDGGRLLRLRPQNIPEADLGYPPNSDLSSLPPPPARSPLKPGETIRGNLPGLERYRSLLAQTEQSGLSMGERSKMANDYSGGQMNKALSGMAPLEAGQMRAVLPDGSYIMRQGQTPQPNAPDNTTPAAPMSRSQWARYQTMMNVPGYTTGISPEQYDMAKQWVIDDASIERELAKIRTQGNYDVKKAEALQPVSAFTAGAMAARNVFNRSTITELDAQKLKQMRDTSENRLKNAQEKKEFDKISAAINLKLDDEGKKRWKGLDVLLLSAKDRNGKMASIKDIGYAATLLMDGPKTQQDAEDLAKFLDVYGLTQYFQ